MILCCLTSACFSANYVKDSSEGLKASCGCTTFSSYYELVLVTNLCIWTFNGLVFCPYMSLKKALRSTVVYLNGRIILTIAGC